MPLKFDSKLNCKFISVYREHECLWRTDSPQYRDKQCRDNAIRKIIEALAMPDLDEVEVKKKIKSLRSTYLTEVKKVQDSIRLGAGTVYKPKIAWFRQMDSFIKYMEKTALDYVEEPGTSAASSDVPEFVPAEVSVQEENVMPTPQEQPERLMKIPLPSKSSKKGAGEALGQIIKTISALDDIYAKLQRTESSNEYDAFGCYVSSCLKNLPRETAIAAQAHIMQFLTGEKTKALHSSV